MFFGKPQPVISDEDYHWQVQTYQWLIANFGVRSAGQATRLVTPTRNCFPDVCRTPTEIVEKTFARVLGYAGMSDWPCLLEVQEPDPETRVARTVTVQDAPSGPAGTFRVDENHRAVITFNPALINDIQSLVATFAHELAHYKTATAASPPPGGWDNWEFATDLAAVYSGFGIFLANTAFQFGQFVNARDGTQGWRARRQGYLSQEELVNALAIFVLLLDLDPAEPEHELKRAWIGTYRKALRYIKSQDTIEQLRSTTKPES